MWFVSTSDVHQEGPFTLPELASRWHTAGWDFDTALLWHEGMDNWELLQALDDAVIEAVTHGLGRAAEELNEQLRLHRSDRRRCEQSWLRAKTATASEMTRSNYAKENTEWVQLKALAEDEDKLTLSLERLSTRRDMLEAQQLQKQCWCAYQAQIAANTAAADAREEAVARLADATEKAAFEERNTLVAKAKAKQEMRLLAKREKLHDAAAFQTHEADLALHSMHRVAVEAWERYRKQQEHAFRVGTARLERESELGLCVAEHGGGLAASDHLQLMSSAASAQLQLVEAMLFRFEMRRSGGHPRRMPQERVEEWTTEVTRLEDEVKEAEGKAKRMDERASAAVLRHPQLTRRLRNLACDRPALRRPVARKAALDAHQAEIIYQLACWETLCRLGPAVYEGLKLTVMHAFGGAITTLTRASFTPRAGLMRWRMMNHYTTRARQAWLEACDFHTGGYWFRWYNELLRRKADRAEAYAAHSQAQVIDLNAGLKDQKEVLQWQLSAETTAAKINQTNVLYEKAALAKHAASQAQVAAEKAEAAEIALDRVNDMGWHQEEVLLEALERKEEAARLADAAEEAEKTASEAALSSNTEEEEMVTELRRLVNDAEVGQERRFTTDYYPGNLMPSIPPEADFTVDELRRLLFDGAQLGKARSARWWRDQFVASKQDYAILTWNIGLRSHAAWMNDADTILVCCEKAGLKRFPAKYMIEDIRLSFHLRGWKAPPGPRGLLGELRALGVE